MFYYQVQLRGMYLIASLCLTMWLGWPHLSQAQSNICAGVSQIPAAECQALVALYHQTQGPQWTERASWLLTDTPCEWYGVTCREEHVVMLALSHNNLQGTLPAELGDLTALEVLDVAENQLTGKLPAELGSLRQLRWLYLNDNAFSGPLPTSLMNLDNLEKVWLYHTQTCTTPDSPVTLWLNHLPDLQMNNVSCASPVTAASLTIPVMQSELICDQVTQISKTECMALVAIYTSTQGADWKNNSNWLQSDMPCSWSGVTCTDNQITELALSQNGLSGTIPSEISGLTELQKLDVSQNQLGGSLPSELGNLKQLTALQAGGNNFTGTLPINLAKLTKLETLDLSGSGLCHPDNKTFEGWLNKMKLTGLATCTAEEMAALPQKLNSTAETTTTMTNSLNVASTETATATDVISVTTTTTQTTATTTETQTATITETAVITTEMKAAEAVTATTPTTDSASAMALPAEGKAAMPQSGGVLPANSGFLVAGLVILGLLAGGMVFSRK